MVHTIGNLTARSGDVLLKMWQVQVEPGKRPLQRHSHTQFELVMVNSGSGSYTTQTGIKPMLPGDFFVFASNEIHCITDVGEDGLRITNLHFEPRYLLSESGDAFSERNANFCFAHGESFQNRIPAEKTAVLERLFRGIEQGIREKPAEYPLEIRSLLNLLIVEIIRHHGYAAERQTGLPQLPGILKAMAFIDAHLEEPLSLSDIAAVAGISPNYFSALFRRICNVTLWDYITAKRVEKAIRMICEETDRTMLEIALACGFNNTANFNKAFKKQTGMTPSRYRSAGDMLQQQ